MAESTSVIPEDINQSENDSIRIPDITSRWTKDILNSLHITTLSTTYRLMDIICGVMNLTNEMDEAAETLKCCICNDMPDGLRNLDFTCVGDITADHEFRLTSENGETFGRYLIYLSTLCHKGEAITDWMYLQLFKNFLEITAPALPKKSIRINGVDVQSNADLLILHEENLETIAVCKVERSQEETGREEEMKVNNEEEKRKIEREKERKFKILPQAVEKIRVRKFNGSDQIRKKAEAIYQKFKSFFLQGNGDDGSQIPSKKHVTKNHCHLDNKRENETIRGEANADGTQETLEKVETEGGNTSNVKKEAKESSVSPPSKRRCLSNSTSDSEWTKVTFTHLRTPSEDEIGEILEGKDICSPISRY
ncbi:hypothetical protein KUTeg_019083 [Tegillarca granosa]|uniref:Uncharacterized protein n=1 Tax=Tegillarca granosa TaxID=220873 RepID=A0ABQ9EFK1_TEGGR|nr:hypothetical protein KUTeg_019083 [Tegillarca granosa]